MMHPAARLPIVIDIETEPDSEWLARSHKEFLASLTPPANYKSPEAIGKWFNERDAERVEKAPLSPIDGRITAISVADLWSDDDPWARVGRGEEADLIRAALREIDGLAAAENSRPLLAGWHINTFDVPFLAARAALHEIRLPDWWPSNPRRFGVTLDAADVLPDGRLALWLARFGLPAKFGDGRDAPAMPNDQLLHYVRNDVLVERALLQRLSLVSTEIASTNPLREPS